MSSLTEIASQQQVTRQTLNSWFAPFWDNTPQPAMVALDEGVLIIDAMSLRGRKEVVLIGRTLTKVVHWCFAEYENYASWRDFLQEIAEEPEVIVCDGKKGLLKAVKELFPNTQVQRCIIHVCRYAKSLTTQHPKSPAGKEMLQILRKLPVVRTRRQKRRWIGLYRKWYKRYESFLKERSTGHENGKKRGWWYTHKKLRAVRTLIQKALPDLFCYIGKSYIPRTSNHVEGGINANLRELIRRHRGLSLEKQKIAVSYTLMLKQ